MKAWAPLVALGALSVAVAAYILWPTQPPVRAPTATTEARSHPADPGSTNVEVASARGIAARGAASRPAAAQPPPWMNLVTQPAGPFAPNGRDSDFAAPMPAGHDPAAMRTAADNLSRWLVDAENQKAQAQMVGVDCRQPPCILSVRHDLPADPEFVGRAERWLSTTVGLGAVHMYTAPVDARQTRQWYFFNPFEDGTPEHHQYASAAIARIDAERRTFGYRDPSEALTGPLTPPPAR